jgi:hypothetical protein
MSARKMVAIVTNYKVLAIAILKQAASDYQDALKKNDEKRIAYFERWFVGDWAQLLSDDMGEVILRKCREDAIKCSNFKWRW